MQDKNFFKKHKYILIAVLFFALDFGLTWYFVNSTPYASEGNPLFEIDGGYTALVVNFLYLMLMFFLEKIVINKYETITFESNNTIDYVKKLMKSDKANFIIASFAFAFIISTLASRLVAIIDWIVFGIYKSNFFTTKYAIIRAKMPLGRFDTIVMLIVFLISLILWFKLEFNKQKKLMIDKYSNLTSKNNE